MIAAAVVLFAFVALCVVAAAYDALTRRPTVRPESLSERHDRLDAEAARFHGSDAWGR